MKNLESSFGKQKKGSYMIDNFIMLFACIVMAWYYYGQHALKLVFVSALTSVLADYFGNTILKTKGHTSLRHSLFIGFAIALVLPASSPLWLPVVGALFAIIVAKLPFGCDAEMPFVPTAAGVAFLTVSFPELMFTYPQITTSEVVVFGSEGFVSADSIASMLVKSNSISVDLIRLLDVLTGNVAGPMGASSTLVMAGIALYMLIRRPSKWLVSAGFVIMAALFAVLFPRIITGRQISLLMELSSGMLLFAALFFMPEHTEILGSPLSKLLYGMGGGALCMLFRYFGVYEEGAVFAVLVMNGLVLLFVKKKPKQDKETSDEEKIEQKNKEQTDYFGFLISSNYGEEVDKDGR